MQKTWRAKAPMWIGGGILLLVLAGMAWVIKGFIGDGEPPAKRQVQQISLVKPPPPKVEEKPPEPKPPEQKQEVPLEQPSPDPVANNDPPDEPMGSTLGPGNDGFGLGKGSGSGRIGGGGSVFARYAALAQQALQERLSRNDKVKKNDYKVVVKMWVSPSGALQRFELAGSSGNADIDAEIKQALAGVHDLREAPPPDMPQPIKLRIVSRS